MTVGLARLRAWPCIALWRRGAARLLLALWSLALLLSHSVNAQAEGALIIRQDRGGWLSERSRMLRDLSRSGQRVELRGDCYSACTLYLGLGNICIAPQARFRFHGPSLKGKPLPATSFDRWSQIMARSYREPLRSWFLTTARYRIKGYYQISGAELIRLGYPSC